MFGHRQRQFSLFYKHIIMTDTSKPAFPDRLSVDPRNKYYVAEIFDHEVGILLNGKERLGVEEYCISEGWITVPAGKTLDRKGMPMMIKVKGVVEPFYR
jgi:hypothetical protein